MKIKICPSCHQEIKKEVKDDVWIKDNTVMVYLNKSKTSFRCSCEGNCFKKHKTKPWYKCNNCNEIYEGT